MRAAWTLTTACAIFVLESAASTTAGGDLTDRRALNLVTGPSRQGANASAAPSILEARDSASAVNSIDHGLSNDEERLGVEAPLEAVEAIGTRFLPLLGHASEAVVETDVQAWRLQKALEKMDERLQIPLNAGFQLKHPSKALKKIDVGVKRDWEIVGRELLLWIQGAKKYKPVFGPFDDTAIVNSLLKKFEGDEDKERLVGLFDWLYTYDGWQECAIKLQRVLRDKLSLEVITPLWQKSVIEPGDVFHMMPIGERPRPKPGAKAEAAWPDILFDSIDWLAYWDEFGTSFTRTEAFDVLVKFRGKEEVLRLSTSLPSSMKGHADEFQVMLYERFPDMRPRLIDIWLESGTTPREAFSLMSIESKRRSLGSPPTLERTFTFIESVAAWTRFNDEFMARSLLFSSDEGKIKLRNELRNAIDTVPKGGATPAQQKKKEEAMETLLKDETVSMLMEVEPLALMSKDEALVTLLKDETKAKQAKDRAIDSLLPRTEGATRRRGFSSDVGLKHWEVSR